MIRRRLLGPAALAGALTTLLGALPAAALPPAWAVVATTPAITTAYEGLSCPTPTTCFGVGTTFSGVPVVRTTTDGGAHWSTVATLAPSIVLGGISCATSTACAATDTTDATVLVTTDGWSTWSTSRLPIQIQSIDAFACRGSACSVVGGDGSGNEYLLTSDSGATHWSSHFIPNDVATFLSSAQVLGCASLEVCTVAGSRVTSDGQFFATRPALFHTSDGGRRWTRPSVPLGVAVTSIDCTSATRCYATGTRSPVAELLLSTDGGASWRTSLRWRGAALDAISCTNGSTCVAAGFPALLQAPVPTEAAVLRTTTSGRTWTQHAVATAVPIASLELSCGSSSTCVLAGSFEGGALEGTADGGTTWSAQDAGTIPPVPEELSCAAAGTCEVLGEELGTGGLAQGYAERTTDDGATWQQQSLPVGVAVLAANLSCPTTTTCFAIGFDELGHKYVLVTTTNSGTTWTASSLPAGLVYVTGMDCPTATDCLAVGFGSTSSTQLEVTTDGGTTWRALSGPSYPDSVSVYFSGVSCSSATSCELAGSANFNDGFSTVATFASTSDFGQSWTTYSIPGQGNFDSGDQPTSVSCGSAAACVATGINYPTLFSFFGAIGAPSSAVFGTEDGGLIWNEEFTLGAQLQEVSPPACVAGGWCTLVAGAPALGASVQATSTDGGATWTSSPMPQGWLASYDLSCPATGRCLSLGFLADGGLGIAALG